jgi:hypothetical protein
LARHGLPQNERADPQAGASHIIIPGYNNSSREMEKRPGASVAWSSGQLSSPRTSTASRSIASLQST